MYLKPTADVLAKLRGSEFGQTQKTSIEVFHEPESYKPAWLCLDWIFQHYVRIFLVVEALLLHCLLPW